MFPPCEILTAITDFAHVERAWIRNEGQVKRNEQEELQTGITPSYLQLMVVHEGWEQSPKAETLAKDASVVS